MKRRRVTHGKEKWVLNGISLYPMIVADNTKVYMSPTSEDYRLKCYSVLTGDLLWSAVPNHTYFFSSVNLPITMDSNYVYIGNNYEDAKEQSWIWLEIYDKSGNYINSVTIPVQSGQTQLMDIFVDATDIYLAAASGWDSVDNGIYKISKSDYTVTHISSIDTWSITEFNNILYALQYNAVVMIDKVSYVATTFVTISSFSRGSTGNLIRIYVNNDYIYFMVPYSNSEEFYIYNHQATLIRNFNTSGGSVPLISFENDYFYMWKYRTDTYPLVLTDVNFNIKMSYPNNYSICSMTKNSKYIFTAYHSSSSTSRFLQCTVK